MKSTLFAAIIGFGIAGQVNGQDGGSTMIANAKYGHTNLIAKDWRALSRFYQDVFGCTPVPPERDFKGPDLERGTGMGLRH